MLVKSNLWLTTFLITAALYATFYFHSGRALPSYATSKFSKATPKKAAGVVMTTPFEVTPLDQGDLEIPLEDEVEIDILPVDVTYPSAVAEESHRKTAPTHRPKPQRPSRPSDPSDAAGHRKTKPKPDPKVPSPPALTKPPKSRPVPNRNAEYAITTFLTGQASDDTYFNSTRLLAYQLLHDPQTRSPTATVTFTVLCGKKLSEAKKQRLEADGATVITLDDVELPEWIHVGEPRWSEQFTKLRVFELTQYKRLLYMDADYFVMHPLDGIFDESIVQQMTRPLTSRGDEVKEDEGPLPKSWLFAARSENGGIDGFDHPVPPLQTDYANAGFFLIAPDKDMFSHLMQTMRCENRFPTTFMEQDMLNYVFRRKGPMPWRELDWKWSANFVNEADVEAGVHSLHAKMWAEGPPEVQKMWKETMAEMVAFGEGNVKGDSEVLWESR